MAGKYGSPSVFWLVDGYNFLSNISGGVDYKVEHILEPTHALGDSWEAHTPTGVSKVTVTQSGAFWDTTTGKIHGALVSSLPTTPQATERIVSGGFAGNTIGKPCICFQGTHSDSYEVLSQTAKLTKANTTYQVTGKAEPGVVLHALGAETADANTEASSVDHTAEDGIRAIPITSSSVASPTLITTTVPHGLTTGDTVLIAGHTGSTPDINGEEAVTVVSTTTFTVVQNVTVGGTGGTIVYGKTNAGGSAYLQGTALTLGGYTDALVKIRDSADDITYGDLVSFAAVTSAPNAQRVTVAGAVERYLAQSVTFEGAGSGQSFTYWAGFSRS